MRVVQAGTGATRDVVIVYHLNATADADVRAAVGPSACILNETVPQGAIGTYGTLGPSGIDSAVDAVHWAQAHAGAFRPARLVLAGFSAGYIAVRTQLLAGTDPDAVVVADGIQSPRPGAPQDVAVWRAYADAAKHGERVFVASHSTQGATNLLSTTETLRLVTGFALDHAGTIDAPVVSRDGNLVVLSYAGNDHHAQGYVVLPQMLGGAMDLLDEGAQETPRVRPWLVALGIAGVVTLGVIGAATLARLASVLTARVAMGYRPSP